MNFSICAVVLDDIKFSGNNSILATIRCTYSIKMSSPVIRILGAVDS
jgi:hypothetical protein